MTTCPRRSSHLSRYLASLRQQQGLKPGQLAARLGAGNLSKVGSLIRSFELGEPLCDHWLEKLIAELQPDPAELQRCLELDQAEAQKRLEPERLAWEAWADEPIQPYISIRCWPLARGDRRVEVPWRFCNSREQAESWAAAEFKRLRVEGLLYWSRREYTRFELGGVNPRRKTATFEGAAPGDGPATSLRQPSEPRSAKVAADTAVTKPTHPRSDFPYEHRVDEANRCVHIVWPDRGQIGRYAACVWMRRCFPGYSAHLIKPGLPGSRSSFPG